MEPDEDLIADYNYDYDDEAAILLAALLRCDEALDRNERPNTSDQRTVIEAAYKYLDLFDAPQSH